MAKDKKRKSGTKSGILLSDDARLVLLGLLIFLLSFIALVERGGYLGNLIGFVFIYLFGVFFPVPILTLGLIGVYLFIKRKKPEFKIGGEMLALIFLFLFALIGASDIGELSVNNVFDTYSLRFQQISGSGFSVVLDSGVGGGLIGFVIYAILHDIASPVGAKLFYILGLGTSVFLLLKPLVFKLGIIIQKRREHRDSKTKQRKDSVQKKFQEFFPASPEGGSFGIDKELQQVKVENAAEPLNISTPSMQAAAKPSSFIIKDVLPKQEPITWNISESNKSDLKNDNIPTKSTGFNIFHDSLNFNKAEVTPVKAEEGTVASPFNVFKDPLFNADTSLETKAETPAKSQQEGDVFLMPSMPKKFQPNQVEDLSGIDRFESREKAAPIKQEFPIETDVPLTPTYEKQPPEKLAQVFRSNEPLDFTSTSKKYHLPSLALLKDPVMVDMQENKVQAELKTVLLNNKFESLGIKATVKNYIVAPSFTRFEIAVSSEVKIGHFTQISNDIMMAVSAEKVNILTPIPGTSYVGIEIPNVRRSTVAFKEVFLGLPTAKRDEKLLTALGKDITGRSVSVEIDKTPHLLVAGTTGSGKSVCINTMIMSLLMRSTPDEVRMLLIDPKRVEMNIYAKIPHLLCPVVTDPNKASVALKRIIEVMEERYTLFEQSGKKNITLYNKFIREVGGDVLPFYVVIVDELADLMLIAPKDVEDSIRRITQLARAAGIHLIVATQRPSVDIITGVIKANIPSRIAFAVSSSFDSRTILDEIGAEELLGKGDMLMHLAGDLVTQRLQGAFISDEEIEAVVEHVSHQRTPHYEPRFLDLDPPKVQGQLELGDELESDNSDDALYTAILDYVSGLKNVSTSLLQRKFGLGFSRAARMIDRLEDEGYIGPINGARPRDVYHENFH